MTRAKMKLSSRIEQLPLSAPVVRGSRGRNGVFTARSLQVYARPADGGNAGLVSIDAVSRREGKLAPIALGLSLEDALILGHELIQAVGHCLGQSRAAASLEAGTAFHEAVGKAVPDAPA